MNDEHWLPIPGFSMYEVSSLGNIRRVRDGSQPRVAVNPRTTYLQTSIKSDTGIWRAKPIHRLVGEAFLGPRPTDLETRHLNGDKYDNRVENLRYGTHSENMQDQVRCGTHYEARKTVCKHGHSLEDARRTKEGHRICRECARLTAERRNAAIRQRRIDEGWDPDEYHKDRRGYWERRGIKRPSELKGECGNGHPRSAENIRFVNGDPSHTVCRPCEKARCAAYRERKRQEAKTSELAVAA